VKEKFDYTEGVIGGRKLKDRPDLHLFTASDYSKRFVHSKIYDPGIGLFGTRFTNPYSPSINKQRKKQPLPSQRNMIRSQCTFNHITW
jgi:hypothetical protein